MFRKAIVRLSLLLIVCSTFFSLGSIWHCGGYNYYLGENGSSHRPIHQFRLSANSLNDGNLNEDQLTCICERDKLLRVGDDLFYSFTPKDATRSTCERLDTLYAQYTPAGTHRFQKCMDHLEVSQKQWNAQNRFTCSDCPDLIHATWKGPLLPTARLGILSFLHAYPKGCVKLKLWVTDASTEESLRANLPLHESLEIVHLNFTSLSDRIMTLHPELQDMVEKSKPHLARLTDSSTIPPVGFSDLVRVFVLAAHGGTYLDCDMLLLKPLTPLLGRDFYYRWQVRKSANTAAIHLRLGSKNAALLVQLALEKSHYGKSQDRLAWVLHPRRLHYYLNRIPHSSVEMLPSAYFDPMWVILKNQAAQERYGLTQWDDFFSERNTRIRESSIDSFFSGAFAFHWHNQWNADIVNGSTADLFLKRYEEMSS